MVLVPSSAASMTSWVPHSLRPRTNPTFVNPWPYNEGMPPPHEGPPQTKVQHPPGQLDTPRGAGPWYSRPDGSPIQAICAPKCVGGARAPLVGCSVGVARRPLRYTGVSPEGVSGVGSAN